jgi:DNA-binding transcriptional LysR family regulator
MKSRVDNRGQRIDLNLLVIFEAIYRSRNLTAAGRALGLSQPAMSQALGRLRVTFNDPLFVRLPGSLQPTPLASEISPALFEGLDVIRESLRRKTFDPIKSVRMFNIGMGDIAEVVHLPQVVRQVHIDAPYVQLNCSTIPGPRLAEALGDGEVDVAAGIYHVGAGCRDVELYESEYACVLRADHPAIGSKLTLKQFQAAEHVLVAPKGASRHAQIIERALTSRSVNAQIAVQVSTFHGVTALITGTDLIATIPGRLARYMQETSNILVLPPPIPLPKFKVSLYWHERFHREPGNAWLRSVFIKQLKV